MARASFETRKALIANKVTPANANIHQPTWEATKKAGTKTCICFLTWRLRPAKIYFNQGRALKGGDTEKAIVAREGIVKGLGFLHIFQIALLGLEIAFIAQVDIFRIFFFCCLAHLRQSLRRPLPSSCRILPTFGGRASRSREEHGVNWWRLNPKALRLIVP